MASSRRAKCSVETLPAGALRVRVYAGFDRVTDRRHHLTEQVPGGRNAEREVEAVRARLVAEVAERRNPRTRATVAELLERHLAQFDGSPNALRSYEGRRNHIGLIGRVAVGQVDAGRLGAGDRVPRYRRGRDSRRVRGRGRRRHGPLGRGPGP